MGRMIAAPNRVRATIGILVGLLLGAIDGTVVATALPRMMDDLGGLKLYFLPTAAFMLASTVSMPIWGRLSDIYGRARFHLFAVIVLMIGSALCGMAHSMTQLSAFRAVQGLGGGGLISLSFTMIGDLYELEQRAKIQGAISGVWGLASLVGPPLGGLITDYFSWRGVFYLNIPVGIVSAVLVRMSWREEKREARGKLDVAGAVLLALTSACLIAAFSLAGHKGWTSTHALGAFATAALLIAVLVGVERKMPDPFLAYDLFRIRLFGSGAAVGVCAVTCLFAAVTYVPLFITGVLGKSSSSAGSVLWPMMVPWMTCSAMSGLLLRRFSYRLLALTGMAFCAGAFFGLDRLGASSTWWKVALDLVLLGAGLGLTVAPLLIAAQNAVPKPRLGAATSLTQFTRSMGGAIGISLMGSLLAAALGGKDPEGLIKARAQMSPEALQALVASLVNGLHHAFRAGVCVAVLGTLLALTIPPGKARDLKTSTP